MKCCTKINSKKKTALTIVEKTNASLTDVLGKKVHYMNQNAVAQLRLRSA